MNARAIARFNALKDQLAKQYGVADVSRQFAVEPTTEQRLQDKIVATNDFLQRINVLPVTELKGQNVYGAAAGPVTGRTDTSVDGKERKTRDVLSLTAAGYELFATESDVHITYATLDAWAKFPDLGERYTGYVQQRIGRDRELIGWHGISAAKDTDLATNPLMQDVNKGWMQYMREHMPANVLTQGATAGELRIGAGGDYACLDLVVFDLLQGIPQYMRDNLVAIVGSDLIAQEKGALFAAVTGKPTEKNAMNMAMTHLGGLPWTTPNNFPSRGLVVTSYDNLSIYYQEGSWRRQIKEEPKKNRVEDYNSRNEGYVVETPEKMTALEFQNVKLPDGSGGWA
jgi:P2 family phage major capsid protein